ncbi:MAG: cytochrome c [Phycisphaerales bacterium]|nr:cytochrome c [Phycisphaerales bacterium]
MKTGYAVGMAVASACGALSIYAVAQSDKAPPPFKPEAHVDDLMHLNNDLNTELRKAWAGTPDWEAAETKARLVAEIANVVRYHQPTDVHDWWTFGGTFRDRARDLVKAVEGKDVEAAKNAHKELFAACKQCHDVYKKE